MNGIRSRTVLAVAAVAIAAATPASSAVAAPDFVAKLSAPGHHPKADKRWPITVTVRTRSGKDLQATVFYQFLFQGQVVSTQYPSPRGPDRHKPYPFKGKMRDPSVTWPARSVGYVLRFRVVVDVKGRGRKNLDYDVRVRR